VARIVIGVVAALLAGSSGAVAHSNAQLSLAKTLTDRRMSNLLPYPSTILL
jgi:hypothetical protein